VGDEGEKASVLRIGITQVKLGEYVEQDDLLRRSALFKKISDTERQVLLHQSKARALKSGEIVLQEALPAKGLYFVLDGAVRLSMQAGITELVTLTKGDVFGLSAVESSAIRPQATAEGDARVALLPAEQVQVLMQTTPRLGDYLRTLASERRKLAEDGASFFDRW
jgi:signal-transduction protein with cAMP-binding, CBS, and nucleotidyltransferase domain